MVLISATQVQGQRGCADGEEEVLRVWHMVTSQMTPLGVRCVYWLKEEGPGSCREISAWPRMRNLQHWGCFRDLLEGPIFVYFAPIIDKFSLSLVFLLAFVSRNNTEHGNTAQCVMISSLQRSQSIHTFKKHFALSCTILLYEEVREWEWEVLGSGFEDWRDLRHGGVPPGRSGTQGKVTF